MKAALLVRAIRRRRRVIYLNKEGGRGVSVGSLGRGGRRDKVSDEEEVSQAGGRAGRGE